MEIRNATITATKIGQTDRGFTAFVTLEVQGSSARYNFGGFRLSPGDSCYDWIYGVCKAVGVAAWEDLPKQYCRIRFENQVVVAIGNLMEENWFDINQFEIVHKNDKPMQMTDR